MISSVVIVNGKEYRVKSCLKCKRKMLLEKFLFLCPKCRRSNQREFDWGRYVDHSREVILEARRHG